MIPIIYKNDVDITPSTEIVQEIRNLCDTRKISESVVFGLMTHESCFDENAENGVHQGLAQINPWWLTVDIPRLEKNETKRNLFNAHDNIITFFEIYDYAMSYYPGMTTVQFCYWYNSGKYDKTLTTCRYYRQILEYAEDIIWIEYPETEEVYVCPTILFGQSSPFYDQIGEQLIKDINLKNGGDKNV